MPFRVLFLLITFAFPIAKAEETVYLRTDQASVWSEPGFSWKDCRPLNGPTTYISQDDKTVTMSRFANGGKQACENRKGFFEAGDTFQLVLGPDGKPLVDSTHKIIIQGELVPKKFYKVTAQGKFGPVEGWISEDQVSEPQKEEPEVFPFPSTEAECPPIKSNATNSPVQLHKNISKFQKQVQEKIALPEVKSEAELDRYMCIYKNAHFPDSDFKLQYKSYKDAAKKASASFHVPYPLLMCTMLVESGLWYNPQEDKEYKGLAQFGSALVEDLTSRAYSTQPYKDQWSKYQSAYPKAELTDAGVRNSPDPANTAPAIALALEMFYRERMQNVRNGELNEDASKLTLSDMYLLVAAYDYSPSAGSLKKIANSSTDRMTKHYPPPRETRNYMMAMNHCISKAQEKNFRPPTKKESREYRTRCRLCPLEADATK